MTVHGRCDIPKSHRPTPANATHALGHACKRVIPAQTSAMPATWYATGDQARQSEGLRTLMAPIVPQSQTTRALVCFRSRARIAPFRAVRARIAVGDLL